MAAPARRPRRRGPPAVAWILVLAVLVGVAAALLSRPVGPAGASTPSLGTLTWGQLGQILLVVLAVMAGLWLYYMFTGERAAIPNRVVATLLVVLLLGVLFVEVAGLVHVAPIPATNSTGGRPPPGGGTGTNGTGNGTSSVFGTPALTVPAWAYFGVVVAVAVLAAVLLVPYMVARVDARRRSLDETDDAVDQARRALQETLRRLTDLDGTDARAAILALYTRLLLIVEPRLGSVSNLTPREIERDSIASLGLRPGVAGDLTETFEEARYSTHPMTVEAVERARAALGEAIADLGPGPGAMP